MSEDTSMVLEAPDAAATPGSPGTVGPVLLAASLIAASALLMLAGAFVEGSRADEVASAVARARAVEAAIDEHRSLVASLPSASAARSELAAALDLAARRSGARVVELRFEDAPSSQGVLRVSEVSLRATGGTEALARLASSVLLLDPRMEVLSVRVSPPSSSRGLPTLEATFLLVAVEASGDRI